MSGDYDYYLARLGGGRPQWTGDNPQSGLFRHFSGEPARIQRDKTTGEMIAFLGSEAVDPVWLWPSVAERCVSKADYLARVDSGAWPGEQPAAAPDADMHGKQGHNSGETADGSQEKIAAAIELITQAEMVFLDATAEERKQLLDDSEVLLADASKVLRANNLGIKAGDKATADRMKDLSDSIKAKRKPLDEMRLLVKRRFDAAADNMHGTFKPTIDALDTASTKLLMIVDSFGRTEKKRLADERQKQIAEEAAKAAAAQAANPLAEVAPIVAAAPPPVEDLSFGRGRKRHVRAPKFRAEISDWKGALADEQVLENDKVRAAVQALADTLAGIKANKPWFKIVEV